MSVQTIRLSARRRTSARARILALVTLLTATAPLHAQHMMTMPPAPLGVSMDRAGSGTTWLPDAVPLPSAHFMLGEWATMLHGFGFAQYDKQGGSRGGSQLGSLNWLMLMASRSALGGRFQPRVMLSLDPWTVTSRGYPLLLQTGETFGGAPLHDRQHPHDFFMELAASYERAISKTLGIQVYAAQSGEPALGPVAFMHRPSAMDNPAAPLGHHWQDATHVSFGVVTAGLFGNRWKLEASTFNGREPDEHRWNIDRIAFDSYSGRLTVNPSASWSFSTSYGFLASPERHEPSTSLHRLSASALYGRTIGSAGHWSTAFVYGGNKMSDRKSVANSWLVESELVVDAKNTLFARAEAVRKSAADLALDEHPTAFTSDRPFDVGALTFGAIREVGVFARMTTGVGASATVNVIPASLRDAYGTRAPLGAIVFIRLRPEFQSRDRSTDHMSMEGQARVE